MRINWKFPFLGNSPSSPSSKRYICGADQFLNLVTNCKCQRYGGKFLETASSAEIDLDESKALWGNYIEWIGFEFIKKVIFNVYIIFFFFFTAILY